MKDPDPDPFYIQFYFQIVIYGSVCLNTLLIPILQMHKKLNPNRIANRKGRHIFDSIFYIFF